MGNTLETAVHPRKSETNDELDNPEKDLIVGKKKKTNSKFERKIVIIGSSGAGKTCLAHRLIQQYPKICQSILKTSSYNELKSCVIKSIHPFFPPPSENISESLLQISKYPTTVLDLPGRKKNRKDWFKSSTLEGTHIFLVVVDSSDSITFPIIAKELEKLHQLKNLDTRLAHTEILFLANKIDKYKLENNNFESLSGKSIFRYVGAMVLKEVCKYSQIMDKYLIKPNNVFSCSTTDTNSIQLTCEWLEHQLHEPSR